MADDFLSLALREQTRDRTFQPAELAVIKRVYLNALHQLIRSGELSEAAIREAPRHLATAVLRLSGLARQDEPTLQRLLVEHVAGRDRHRSGPVGGGLHPDGATGA